MIELKQICLIVLELLFFYNRSTFAVLGVDETCEDVGLITHFDWDELTSNISHIPFMNYTIDIDESTLELLINVELEYLGDSFADDHTPGYGTTYVLDFEDYDAESDDIRLPGNCQNRFLSDFISPTFNELWGYSDTPYTNNHLGNESYLAYPPSGSYWDLTINNTDDANAPCTPVHYEGRFTWSELRGCSNYNGLTEYTVIETDENWLNLSGVFYINAIAPLSKNMDLGYYRVYQMLSAPFTIALRNQINIISSVGINLFTVTIIAVYKEDLETDFRLIVLTESADFLMLNSPFLLDSPTLNPDTINFDIETTPLNTGCLTASSNICSQLWEIYANDVSCPPTNFTGNYGLEFTAICNPDANYTNNTELCNDYINQYGNEVVLSTPLEWYDNICDPETFIIQFDAEMLFYNDSNYLPQNELGDSDQYSFGDRAYVEININTPPDSTFDLIELNLQNVWVCTTNPDNEPLALDSQNLGLGGCLSDGSIIDIGFPWHLVVNGDENDLTEGGDVTLYEPWTNGTIRFSFVIDSSISRVNLYVQAQVTLDLISSATTTTEAPRRRRRLLQIDNADTTNNASQTRHFEGATGININGEVITVVIADDDTDDMSNDDDTNPETTPIDIIYYIIGGGIIGVMLCGCCLAVAVCLFFKNKKDKLKMEIEIKDQLQRNRAYTGSSAASSRKNTVSSNEGPMPVITPTKIEIVTPYN